MKLFQSSLRSHARSRVIGLTTLCASVAMMASSVFAEGKQDFVLHNQTGLNVHQIFLAPHIKDTPWQEFVLEKGALNDGEDAAVTFNGDEEEDNWDLKLVDQDGKEYIWGDLNLPSITGVTIYLKDGKAWAQTDGATDADDDAGGDE